MAPSLFLIFWWALTALDFLSLVLFYFWFIRPRLSLGKKVEHNNQEGDVHSKQDNGVLPLDEREQE